MAGIRGLEQTQGWRKNKQGGCQLVKARGRVSMRRADLCGIPEDARSVSSTVGSSQVQTQPGRALSGSETQRASKSLPLQDLPRWHLHFTGT
jgi:hypothetical protein